MYVSCCRDGFGRWIGEQHKQQDPKSNNYKKFQDVESRGLYLLLAGGKEVEKESSLLEAPVQKPLGSFQQPLNLLSERWRVIYLFCYISLQVSFKGT